jgi:hypothetical protein
MEFILLTLRLLLAAVFGVAAVGKLRAPKQFRDALVTFGVPPAMAGGTAFALLAAEVVTAVLLVSASEARWGAWLGVTLLTVFSVAVAVSLIRGRTPDCRCFGQLTAMPIGAATLVRNAVLASCAVSIALVGPGSGVVEAVAWWTAASSSARVVALGKIAVVVALAGLAWLVSRLHDQHTALTERVVALERRRTAAVARTPEGAEVGLPQGSPAPSFDLPLMIGGRASIETLTASGRPVVLVFSSAHCPSCADLWPDIGPWQREPAPYPAVVVVATGSATAIELKLMGSGVRDVVLAEGAGLAEAYRVAGIPSAVVVSPARTVDSDTVTGPAAIRDLVRQQAGR